MASRKNLFLTHLIFDRIRVEILRYVQVICFVKIV